MARRMNIAPIIQVARQQFFVCFDLQQPPEHKRKLDNLNTIKLQNLYKNLIKAISRLIPLIICNNFNNNI